MKLTTVRPTRQTAAVLLAAVAAISTPGSANADATTTPGSVQGVVDGYLRAHPGGKQTSDRDISYADGTFIVTVARPDAITLAAADCPSGWYCFYDGINYTYPRGRLSSCGWQDLATWGWRNRIESAHYNMSSGTVAFLHENGATDTRLFTVGTSSRTLANAGTNSNRADYVSRTGC
ncbi:peptidase inhibitor family I36 protein [Actinoplanes couchii]|uniref:Peptidase inhibitor family I36 n=1 Tax=Actinoplanes couchii TaxID=403638 RepID=A0ABQ3XSX4_9ACTN|nr:peptidase inhibitor family I36 protein [Actinoplanes couchii]MDR6324078.1 hypothetical protein [Actinoplanes couchii]GID61604.1 hypothetical protein Aco03nite_100080 [Actinoplanes couchii]